MINITAAYVMGVIVGKISNPPLFLSFSAILLILIFIIWYYLNKKNTTKLLLLLFLLIGLLNYQVHNLPLPQNDISRFPKFQPVTLIGQVEDEPRVKEDKIFFTFKVKETNGRKSGGLVSVISQAGDLQYGDSIEINGFLTNLESLANPGLSSFADYLNNQGIYCQLRATRSPPKVLAHGGGNFFKKISITVKNRLVLVPQQTMPEPYASLLTSMVFGTQASSTSPEVKDIYKRAGVSHLLVASGMQVSIMVGLCLFLIRSARLPLGLGVVITSLFNFLCVLVTGGGPSIWRAAIMAEIMLLGLWLEKEGEIYTSLALSAWLILLFDPNYLFNIGFQLSFGATWSLVYLGPVMSGKLSTWLPKPAAVLVAAASSPVFATAPITLYYFSQVSLIGIVTNILLLPWINVLVILGFAATILGLVCLPLAEIINGANLILLWGADQVVRVLSAAPMAQLFLPTPSLISIAAYYVGLVWLVEKVRSQQWPKFSKFNFLIIVLGLSALLVWQYSFSTVKDGLVITVFDVGQGDSILIESPSGKKVLVDGGPEPAGKTVVVPFLQKRGINRLDLVILTHPHEDHAGGLLTVLEKIKVDSVLEPAFDYSAVCYRRFLELINKNNIKYHIGRAGQVLDFGAGVTARLFHPKLQFIEGDGLNCNNASIVFRLQYGAFSMMFTGDSEQEGEAAVLASFSPSILTSSILKAGHHGSATSSSLPFLEAVRPQYAIVSCGRHNKFRHPHQSTLKKLQALGVKLFRTDQEGAITIKTDGKNLAILPQR